MNLLVSALLVAIFATTTTPVQAGFQLTEEGRLAGYHARNYTWPRTNFVPNTPGWKALMERRLRQVELVEDPAFARYEGFVRTIHAATLVQNFTEHGFGLARCPNDLLEALQKGIRDGLAAGPSEEEITDAIVGPKPPLIVSRPDLTERVLQELKHYAETWAQMPLTPHAAYGFRLYQNESQLYMHVDRMQTHIISFILHIDSSEDAEPWPIYIEDFHGHTHEVILTPGDMLFYESSKCFHGRPKKLNGTWYSSLFVHYYPTYGWQEIDREVEAVYAVPPHWGYAAEPLAGEVVPPRLEMVGTSMKEPDCPNEWCATMDTVKWSGPGEEGKWIAPTLERYPFEPQRVIWNEEESHYEDEDEDDEETDYEDHDYARNPAGVPREEAMLETDRLEEYHKRNYTWPLNNYSPNTHGWKTLMEHRLRQVEHLPMADRRYEGFIRTIHAASLVPNFTEHGFGLARCPDELLDALQEGIYAELESGRISEEPSSEGIAGPNRPLFVDRPDLTELALLELHPYAEAWAQIPLTPHHAYGFRLYQNESQLFMHIETMQTNVISFILHIDSSQDAEPWPLFIEDFNGNTHEVVLTPGDMLIYESSKCFHGYPKKFNGSWYSSVLVHYYPDEHDWIETDHELEAHYAVPPHWSREPLPEEAPLPRLEIVGSSLKEPECPNDWCASQNTVKWGGPGEEGLWIAPTLERFPLEPEEVMWDEEL